MTTLEAQHEVITNLILENQKLKQERDEAREEWGKASMDAAKLLSEKTKVMGERDEARESLENARELNKWLTVFLEHIRDNATLGLKSTYKKIAQCSKTVAQLEKLGVDINTAYDKADLINGVADRKTLGLA